MPAKAEERREVRFRGDVQGVGFRYTTQRIAADFAVQGFVKNLPDGSVQLVVEGAKQVVDQFCDRVHGAMRENIHDQVVHSSAPTGEFTSFEIRY